MQTIFFIFVTKIIIIQTSLSTVSGTQILVSKALLQLEKLLFHSQQLVWFVVIMNIQLMLNITTFVPFCFMLHLTV